MGTFLLLAIALASLAFLLSLIYVRRKNYFESKGVYYMGDSIVTLVRNLSTGVNFFDDVQIKYRRLKSDGIKVGGIIDFGQLSLFVTDPEICKTVMVKDFESFQDRRAFSAAVNDEVIFDKMLFLLQGERWKRLRTKLSPTFTTGKIKRLFSLFEASGDKFVKFIQEEIEGKDEMDLTTAYSKYTMDVIASAACGMDSKAFDQREPSLFERMGKQFTIDLGVFKLLKIVVMAMAPKVAVMMGFKFVDSEVNDFFMGAIKSQIHYRQKNNVKGNDFIQLMMEAREGTLKTEENEIMDAFEKDAVVKPGNSVNDSSGGKISELLDDDGIVANAALFILAGFDSTQSLLLFVAYFLALHQDVQERLRAEIEDALEGSGGRFDYDAVSKLTYLDMIISETLRYCPPNPFIDRKCTTAWKMPGTDYVLQPGEAIQIPAFGFHHDPEYWEDPQKWDPERFSPENKGKIVQYAYHPFGNGPRNCIGMRFALAEAKVALANLIYHFKLGPSKSTLIPMKFSTSSTLKPQGGMWLSLQKISR